MQKIQKTPGDSVVGVEESLHILDKRRLETKQRLTASGGRGGLNYEVETWFFLPASLQINRWNYDPQNCRQRLKNYIRENAPLTPLTELCGGHPLLVEAAELLERLQEVDSPPRAVRLEEVLRLYALLYHRSLAQERRGIENRFRQGETEEAAQAALALCRQALTSLVAYRSLRAQAKAVPLRKHPADGLAGGQAGSATPGSPPLAAFAYCDEFLGIITTHHLSRLLEKTPPHEESVQRRLKAALKAQMRYRLALYPESVPEEEGDNEIPLYRWSVLKKYVSAPLFLEARPRTGTHPLVHTVYVFSAAFAMTVATAITLIMQKSNGTLTPTLFAVILVAYIFRERFKDIFRHYLFKLTQRWVPDRRQVIYADHNRAVGRCDESFRFMAGEKHLPPEARLMRDRQHIVEVDNSFRSEDILYYSKTVDIFRLPNPFAVGTPQVMDIWRFDITDFLLHTTEAPEELPVIDDERIPLGTKVYHVNMIRKITQNRQAAWERYRFILTSEGIKRVDEVFPLSSLPAGDSVPQ